MRLFSLTSKGLGIVYSQILALRNVRPKAETIIFVRRIELFPPLVLGEPTLALAFVWPVLWYFGDTEKRGRNVSAFALIRRFGAFEIT